MVKLRQEAASRQFPAGTVIDGRYRVIRFIGQGGAGVVHEVEHVRTGRRLAMKSLHNEAGLARLEQEAKATSLMKNPHAVKITDMGTGSGVAAGAYVVMDLLEGQSLRARMAQAGRLPVELAVNIALQVCECLAEAHRHGIIHRDLKPENVFLTASPWPGQHDVKVLDFGVVKISPEGALPHASLTRTGATVGTPYYMSLEQLRNPSGVDARADIYSLGVVLYECLAGRKPFEAGTIGDLVYAICSGPPPSLAAMRPDAPAEMCEVVMRALSVTREDRQASMEDLAAALLPFGNPAFGLWLGDGPRRGDAAGRRSSFPASARAEDARAEAAEAVRESVAPAPPRRVSVASDGGVWGGRSAAPRPAAAQPAARAGSRDTRDTRDTPTDMYQKGEEPVPEGPAPEIASPASLASLENGRGPGQAPERFTTMQALAPQPLAAQAPGVVVTLPERYAELAASITVTAPLRSDPATDDDLEATLKLPQNRPRASPYPPGALLPPPYPQAAQPPPGAPPFPQDVIAQPWAIEPARPSWQRSLDGALVRVGGFLERTGGGAATRLREASPGERLALVVGGASLVAAMLVLLLLLLLG